MILCAKVAGRAGRDWSADGQIAGNTPGNRAFDECLAWLVTFHNQNPLWYSNVLDIREPFPEVIGMQPLADPVPR